MDIKIAVTPGTLKERIPESRVNGINSLTLSGSINGDDIEFLRKHTGGYDMVDHRNAGPLETLDLSNCKLVPGGRYKSTEFMGHQRGRVSISQFMEMWTTTEIAGPGYGFNLVKGDEISDEMFLKCYKLRSIFLPKDIKRVGDLSFYRCDNLTRIYLGDKVESIGEFVFENNFSLKEIHIKSKKPPKLSDYAFGNPKYQTLPEMNPKKKITLFVPNGSSSDYWLQWGFDNVIEEY